MNKIKEMWNWLIKGEQKEKETEFLPAILEVTETPPSPTGRLVMWSILGLIVIGLAWSILGHINEVAVASGKVIPSGQAKTIQVKNKGIVKEIRVKEGQEVKEGDVLVLLDPTTTGADYDTLKKRAAYYKLDIQRLEAELEGKPFLPEDDPDLEAHDRAAEMALYQSRVSDYTTQRRAAMDVVSQKTATLEAAKSTYERYSEGLAIAREKERLLEQLMEENAVARFQLLDQRNQRNEYEKNAQATMDHIISAQAEIAEAQQKLANIDAAYKKDVMTSMVQAKKEYYDVIERIKKAEEDARMTTIVAPCDGRVYNLSVHTVGGIVTDAQPLMIIVPDDVDLEFEVYADNKDIGFIKEGQTAEVKVETYNFQKFGIVEAEVMEISADSVDDNKDMEKNKKFRLLLRPVKTNINVFGKEADLSPGMNVTAEIKIKEKRIIDFFMDPFRRYTNEALRER